jgi:exosortase/archaeosortase family protein
MGTMLQAFIIVAAMLAYAVKPPRWQKVILVLSSIPMAFLCEVARISAAAGLPTTGLGKAAKTLFPHLFAGPMVLLLAALLLAAELWLMKRLVRPRQALAGDPGEGPRP